MFALSNFLTSIFWLATVVILFIWSQRLQKARLQRWAVEHRFEILEAKPCYLLRGPFQWSSSRHQAVYRISIRDAQNELFSGWVCMGHFSWMLPGEFRVEWDGLKKPRSF